MPDIVSFLTDFFDFPLTPSQNNAAQKISEFLQNDKDYFILKGYAGTGKTTLLNGIAHYLVQKKQQFRLMAPTGRAAKVIVEKTKFDATTIHKGIYSLDDLREYKETSEDGSESFKYYFELRNNDDPVNTVYMVDESSMVSDKYAEAEFFRFGSGCLFTDLVTYIGFANPTIRRKVVFIGDSAQLPPVFMNFSPALCRSYLSRSELNLTVDEYEMRDVARHEKDSGILANATQIREQIRTRIHNRIQINTGFGDIQQIQHHNIVDLYMKGTSQGDSEIPVIIAYANKTVQNYNELIRDHLFPETKQIQSGDRVLVVRNNYKYGVLNGEFGVVKKVISSSEKVDMKLKRKTGDVSIELRFRDVVLEVSDLKGNPVEFPCKIVENLLDSKERGLTSDETRALYVHFIMRHPKLKRDTAEFKETLRADPYFNALQVKYGYAVTCHKAQGGEWNKVIVDFSTSHGSLTENYFRWCYTALTRCRITLYCLNPPDIGPSDKLKWTAGETSETRSSSGADLPPERTQSLPGHLAFQNSFQQSLCRKVISTIGGICEIEEILHLQYAERYFLGTNQEKTIIDLVYNKKNVLTSIRLIKAGSESDIIKASLEVLKGSTIEAPHLQVKSEKISFPQDKPYLLEFYQDILKKLEGTVITVVRIVHHDYHEKYFFKRGHESVLFHFYYNSRGRFTSASPDVESSESKNLFQEIKDLI